MPELKIWDDLRRGIAGSNWFLGLLGAASFSCLMAIWIERPAGFSVHLALYFFALGLPALAIQLIKVHTLDAALQTRASQDYALAGALGCVVGIFLFIWSMSYTAALLFAISGIGAIIQPGGGGSSDAAVRIKAWWARMSAK